MTFPETIGTLRAHDVIVLDWVLPDAMAYSEGLVGVHPEIPAQVELTGRFEPEEERCYRHVPFTVPPGVRQVHIEIDYNDRIGASQLTRGGNTLDIGLFDERGTAAGGEGFRGWSGSELQAFTIDDEWATPPYRAGSIGAGLWHLLLGPYKIGRRGLEYRISIWFDSDRSRHTHDVIRTCPSPRLEVPTVAEPGWVRGDLHTHSRYSDGDSWPSEMLIVAAERGLDFLAVTDHNGAVRAAAGDEADLSLPLLIPGIEVTTYRGHWNVWGVDGWFDFRTVNAGEVREEMKRARESGGVVGINHPKPFGPEWEYERVDDLIDTIEIWNGPWERLNVFALAEWDQLLMAGRRVVAVGGSDAHYLRSERVSGPMRDAQIGEPTTWVQIDGALTTASLLAGLRSGRVFVSVSPAGPQLILSAVKEHVALRVVGAEGCQIEIVSGGEVCRSFSIDSPDWRLEFPFPGAVRYVRAQVLDGGGQHVAISNPIWRDDVG